MIAVGSLGDVQPMVAIGAGLVRVGHEVRLSAGDDFESLTTAHGIEFIPSGVRVDDVMTSPAGLDWAGHSSHSSVAGLKAMRRLFEAAEELDARPLDGLVGTADLWITGGLGLHAINTIASLGGGRVVLVGLAPMRPTRAGWASMAPPRPDRYSVLNLLTAHAGLRMIAPTLAIQGDALRRRLGLKPTGGRGFLAAAEAAQPILAVSPTVVPPPLDWKGIPVTGYPFLNDIEAGAYAVPPTLATFLAEGERPAYVGFGSMSSRAAAEASRMVAEAARLAKVRVVLSSGLAGMAAADDEWVHGVDHVPHDWLFTQVCGAVHHGGAGTTHTAFRTGTPQAVVAHLIDQPYWGRRVHELGVGPKPVLRHALSAEWLTEALRGFAAGTWSAAATEMSDKVRGEDGVAATIDAMAL
ncbi:glycosyltransferase [Knoellia sinensis]|nr:glycosyltransferase [Knoellia sinensis]